MKQRTSSITSLHLETESGTPFRVLKVYLCQPYSQWTIYPTVILQRLFPFPPIQYQNVVLEDVFSFVTSSQSHQCRPVDRVRDPIQSSKGVYMLTNNHTEYRPCGRRSYRVFFSSLVPLKSSKYKKLI